MKRLMQMVCLTVALLGAGSAGAFTYLDGDLLLVFRQDGFNDLEFNLGAVTNLLRLSSGTTVTITNFNAATVKANFNNNLSSVKFVVLSTTNTAASVKYAYLSDGDPTSNPLDGLTISAWRQLQSKLNYTGTQAALYSGTNATEVWNPLASDASAYTYIMTDGLTPANEDVTTLNGLAPFSVETGIPGTNRFFIVRGFNPPTFAPATQVGSFNMTINANSNGVPTLTFTAGTPVVVTPPPVPTILSVSHTGTTTSIQVSSVSGVNYRLHYTGSAGLRTPLSSWPILASVVATGTTTTLVDSTAPTTNRFYKVEASH